MSSNAEPDYTGTAVSGAAWQGMVGLAIRIMRSIIFLVLARLLVPEAFGVVALATVFTTVLRHFTGGGFSQALIQQLNLTKSHLDTAFYVNIAIGVVLTGALAATAGHIADWMDEPDLHVVLLGLSAMPLLAGVSSVPEGLLARQMNFRSLSLRHLIAAASSSSAALVLALAGAGVWALVAQTLIETIVSCIVLWMAVRRTYRPGLQISARSLRDLSGFGFKVVGYDLTMLISTRADDFLIGAVLGSRALGLYSVAYRLLTILQETLQGVVASVAFPLYARLQDDQVRLARGFLRASRLSLAIAGPIFLYVAFAAPQIVSLTLGDRWTAAAPVMSALALSGVASVVIDMDNTLLQARGQAGRVLAFSLVSAAANLVGFAISVRYGIFWVAVAFTVRAYVFLPWSLRMVAVQLGSGVALLRAYGPIVLLLVVPILTGVATGEVAESTSNLVAVGVSGPIGAVVYLLGLRVLARSAYEDIIMVGMKVMGRRRTGVM